MIQALSRDEADKGEAFSNGELYSVLVLGGIDVQVEVASASTYMIAYQIFKREEEKMVELA